ncbi:MAG: hypothetical protein ABIP53_03785 [Candidatus Limnocylindrales bacterium]
MGSDRLVRRLCWALVVLAISTTVVNIAITFGLIVPFPNIPDETGLVDRVAAFRASDVQLLPLIMIGSLASIGVFLVAAMLGVALRPYASGLGWRDAMATLLVVGGIAKNWLNLTALTIVSVGVALAGRLVSISSAWRLLSYAISALILLAVAMRIIAAFVFVPAFDPFQVSDVLVGLASGILVPIWAIMLARRIGSAPEMPAEPDMAAA